MNDISDKTLGTLRYNAKLRAYEGTLTTSVGVIKLSLEPDGQTVDQTLKLGRQLIAEFEHFLGVATNRLVSDMMPLKNLAWLDENEKPLSEVEFRRRAQLESVTVYGGGLKTFGFADDDMFAGHWLVVNIGKDGVAWKAELFG